MDMSAVAQQAAMQGNMSEQALREVSVRMSADTGPFQKEMQKASSAVDVLADSLHKADQAYKNAMKAMGGVGMGLGMGMTAQATASAWQAAAFEEQFARVAKTTGLENTLAGHTGRGVDTLAAFGIGDNELQTFENDIRSLSTQLPVATQELSYLADVAGTLGVESDNLALFSQTAAQLGAGINELGSDQAISGLANLIGAFGMAETSVVDLGSSLAELANHTRGNASDMLQFSDRMAGTAVQVGMTAEEVLGLGAAVSAIGVMPELGASAVTQVVTKISRAMQEGGEDARDFADAMNMSAEELQTMWNEQGATATLMQFLESLSQQGEAASLTLRDLGLSGVNITQVFGGLSAQMHTVRDAMGISNQAFEEGTAVAELAEVRFDTVIQRLQVFRQSIGEVATSLGQSFLGAMKTAVDSLTGMVNLFNVLPQPIKTTLGVFTSLGGALLIAGGAFTIFYAQFHLFFAAAQGLAVMLPRLVAYLGGLGAAGAASAGHLAVLSNMLNNVMRHFRNVGIITGFASLLRSGLTRALGLATAGVAALATGMRRLLAYIAAHTIHNMVWVIKQLGNASLAASTKVALLAAPLAKIALLVGGLGAAIYALTGGKQAWARATEEQLTPLRELADAIGLTASEVRDLNTAFDEGEDRKIDLAIDAKDEIDELRELSEEGARQRLMVMTFELLHSGNPPEQVQQQIEELIRLSDHTIEFEWDLQSLTIGDQYEDLAEAIGTSISDAAADLDPMDDGWLATAMAGLSELGNKFGLDRSGLTPGEEARIDGLIESVSRLAEGQGTHGRMALYTRLIDDIDTAVSEGELDTSQERNLREAVDALNLVPEQLREDQRGFWDRVGLSMQENIPGLGWLNEKLGGDQMLEWGPQEMFAQALEDTTLSQSDDIKELERIVRRTLGWSDDLGQALRNASDADFDKIITQLEEIQLTQNEIALDAMNAGTEFDTQIGRILAEAAEMDEEQDAKRMLDHFFEAYPERVGFEKALEDANIELQKLIDSGEEWGEEADRIRSAIQEWSTGLAEMHVHDITQGLNASTAIEQISELQERLDGIDTDAPYRAEVEVAVREQQMQLHQQEIQEFRQTMERYDALQDQKAQIKEQADEREAKMQEDHDQRIIDMEDANNERVENLEQNHSERKAEMREDYQRNVEKSEENHQRRLEEMREDHQRNLLKSEENHERRLEDMRTELHRRLEEMEENFQRSRGESIEDHERRTLRMEEDQQRRKERMHEDHNRRLKEMRESRDKSIEEANKAHKERLEDINKAEKEALEERVRQQAAAFSILERVQARPTASLGALLDNMEAQNRAMKEMNSGVNQLRRMGLGDEVMKELGFEDPANFAQVRRLLEAALSDPSMIDEINAKWKRRMDLSEAFFDFSGQEKELRKGFEEQREAAKEAIDKQIGDINERYRDQLKSTNEAFQRSVDDANENFSRSMADHVENHQRSLEKANENHQRAVAQAHENHARQVDQANENHQRQTDEAIENHERQIDKANENHARQAEEAAENHARQLEKANENHAKQIDEANENHIKQLDDAEENLERQLDDAAEARERQLEQIADQLEELGDRSFETIDELIEKASSSGLKKLEEWADAINDIQLMLFGTAPELGFKHPAQIDADYGITYDWRGNAATAVGLYGPENISAGRINGKDVSWQDVQNMIRSGGAGPARTSSGGGASSGGSGSGSTNTPLYPRSSRADGGIDNLPDAARIQRAGTLVQWAEPETGGEAFIPLAASKRAQSLGIWRETGEHLGVDMARFARGGFLDAAQRQRGREPMGGGPDLVKAFTRALENASLGSSETNHWDVTVKANDPRQMLSELEAKKRLSRLTRPE